MKKTPRTSIDKYFIKILTSLDWKNNNLLKFTELIGLFKSEIISIEHMFLLLHKCKYITSHDESIRIIQGNLEAGIPTSFNHLLFRVNEVIAYQMLKEHLSYTRKTNTSKKGNDSDQYTLNFNL